MGPCRKWKETEEGIKRPTVPPSLFVQPIAAGLRTGFRFPSLIAARPGERKLRCRSLASSSLEKGIKSRELIGRR